MALIKRVSRDGVVAPPPLPTGAPTVVFRLPALIEFVTLQQWDDGKARKSGSLSLSWSDGAFKLYLNDKDSGLSAFLAGVTPEDLFLTAEGKLTENSLDWKRSYSAGRKGFGK